jgi:hypothetical protein
MLAATRRPDSICGRRADLVRRLRSSRSFAHLRGRVFEIIEGQEGAPDDLIAQRIANQHLFRCAACGRVECDIRSDNSQTDWGLDPLKESLCIWCQHSAARWMKKSFQPSNPESFVGWLAHIVATRPQGIISARSTQETSARLSGRCVLEARAEKRNNDRIGKMVERAEHIVEGYVNFLTNVHRLTKHEHTLLWLMSLRDEAALEGFMGYVSRPHRRDGPTRLGRLDRAIGRLVALGLVRRGIDDRWMLCWE